MAEPTDNQVRAALASVTAAACYLAERHALRTQTDFIVRMGIAFGEIDAIQDEYPDSDVVDRGQAERLHEALLDLAGLAMAQAAFLEARHPSIAFGEDEPC